MKLKPIVFCATAVFATILVSAVLLTACSPTSQPTPVNPSGTSTNTPATNAPSGTSPGQTPISSLDLGLIQTGATLATGVVLDFAVTQTSTRQRLANEIYSSANFLYKASGGTPPTPADFALGLTAYGLAGDTQYAQYTSALSSLYSTYYTKYIVNGSVTTQNFAAVLNSLAAGAESAASVYATVPPPTAVPAPTPTPAASPTSS